MRYNYLYVLILGFLLGAVPCFVYFWFTAYHPKKKVQEEIISLRAELQGARVENADNRETMRNLRYQLAQKSPVVVASVAENSESITDLEAEIERLHEGIAERDQSLLEARQAIGEIRRKIEAGGLIPESFTSNNT